MQELELARKSYLGPATKLMQTTPHAHQSITRNSKLSVTIAWFSSQSLDYPSNPLSLWLTINPSLVIHYNVTSQSLVGEYSYIYSMWSIGRCFLGMCTVYMHCLQTAWFPLQEQHSIINSFSHPHLIIVVIYDYSISLLHIISYICNTYSS